MAWRRGGQILLNIVVSLLPRLAGVQVVADARHSVNGKIKFKRGKYRMSMITKMSIDEGFKNKETIHMMVEDVAHELGISHKLKEIKIKHTPSESPIDMNYLNAGKKSLVLEIVDDLDNLEGRVIHELMHVFDQLEGEFQYRESSVPREGTGAHRRYKYLWNVYIDGRLVKRGKPAYNTREEREKEIEECYPELSADLRKSIFDFLWGQEVLNHQQIVGMSHDLFSCSKELKSLADSRREKLQNFKTAEELKNYKQQDGRGK